MTIDSQAILAYCTQIIQVFETKTTLAIKGLTKPYLQKILNCAAGMFWCVRADAVSVSEVYGYLDGKMGIWYIGGTNKNKQVYYG